MPRNMNFLIANNLNNMILPLQNLIIIEILATFSSDGIHTQSIVSHF